MIYKLLINLSLVIIFAIILRSLYRKLFLIKTFNLYIKSLKALKDIDFKSELPIVLDKISLNGLILLLKLIFFLIPYFLYFGLLILLEYKFQIAVAIAFIPYLLMLRK